MRLRKIPLGRKKKTQKLTSIKKLFYRYWLNFFFDSKKLDKNVSFLWKDEEKRFFSLAFRSRLIFQTFDLQFVSFLQFNSTILRLLLRLPRDWINIAFEFGSRNKTIEITPFLAAKSWTGTTTTTTMKKSARTLTTRRMSRMCPWATPSKISREEFTAFRVRTISQNFE